MHFGQGSAGTPGTGFQLLIIIFMLLFGVSLGQLVAALSPSVQVAAKFICCLVRRLMQHLLPRLPSYSTLSSHWFWVHFVVSPFRIQPWCASGALGSIPSFHIRERSLRWFLPSYSTYVLLIATSFAKIINAAVWSSDATAMSGLFSLRLPGRRVPHGAKTSSTILVAISTTSMIQLLVGTASMQWATNTSCPWTLDSLRDGGMPSSSSRM